MMKEAENWNEFEEIESVQKCKKAAGEITE